MNDAIFLSNRDMLLYAVPLFVALFFTMFRLDEFLISPKGRNEQRDARRKSMRTSMYSDPDGTPWEA